MCVGAGNGETPVIGCRGDENRPHCLGCTQHLESGDQRTLASVRKDTRLSPGPRQAPLRGFGPSSHGFSLPWSKGNTYDHVTEKKNMFHVPLGSTLPFHSESYFGHFGPSSRVHIRDPVARTDTNSESPGLQGQLRPPRY